MTLAKRRWRRTSILAKLSINIKKKKTIQEITNSTLNDYTKINLTIVQYSKLKKQ